MATLTQFPDTIHESLSAILSVLARHSASVAQPAAESADGVHRITAVIAVGIATSVVAITLYHAKAGNPIWWKNDVLYRVMVDSRPTADETDNDHPHPEYPPFTLIYRDALAIYQSKIPTRSLMMAYSSGLLDSLRPGSPPIYQRVRVTTREFFRDVRRCLCSLDADGLRREDSAKIRCSGRVVISHYLNDRLFGGGNNVGHRSNVNAGQRFTVIGVLAKWVPLPRFYDEARDFGPPDDVIHTLPLGRRLCRILIIKGFCLRSKTLLSGFHAAGGDLSVCRPPVSGVQPGYRLNNTTPISSSSRKITAELQQRKAEPIRSISQRLAADRCSVA